MRLRYDGSMTTTMMMNEMVQLYTAEVAGRKILEAEVALGSQYDGMGGRGQGAPPTTTTTAAAAAAAAIAAKSEAIQLFPGAGQERGTLTSRGTQRFSSMTVRRTGSDEEGPNDPRTRQSTRTGNHGNGNGNGGGGGGGNGGQRSTSTQDQFLTRSIDTRLRFPQPDSYPRIFKAHSPVSLGHGNDAHNDNNGGGAEGDLDLKCSLSATSRVAMWLRRLADQSRVLGGEEREDVGNALGSWADEYVEGWESDGDDWDE